MEPYAWNLLRKKRKPGTTPNGSHCSAQLYVRRRACFHMQPLKILFSLEGRINRLQFWAALAVIAAVTVGLFAAGRQSNTTGTGIGRAGALVAFALLLAFTGWTLVAVSIKRWHDMGLSGLMTLLWLVPFIGPVIVIGWLGFGPSKHVSSRRR